MRKKRKEFHILIVLILIAGIFVVSPAQEGKEKISEEVYEELEKNEEVIVYINLKKELHDVKDLYGVRATKARTSVAEVADFIGKNKVRYKFKDKLSAEINEKDLSKLKQDPRIESVELVGFGHITLHNSVPLIEATNTHASAVKGVNLTGTGQSICILDTGINYTHPDLGGCSSSDFLSGNCGKVLDGYDYVNNDNDPMDDDGHGTHVAGIAAANGGIIGVAPDANILAVKVCDSNGECAWDHVEKGVDWCINNASKYNISVISMSIGGGTYSGYCNTFFVADEINNAVGKNISVVIATGNDHEVSRIAAPACVQNATPVGATNNVGFSVDTIPNEANRNNLTMLLAPGYLINSTCITGGYCGKIGTSMATPHVSGAVAIINQFLELNGMNETPEGIELVLNKTGKFIIDTASGAVSNYTRINVHDAINSYSFNYINLSSPANNTFTTISNNTFSCNVSAVNFDLVNITFQLWNSTDLENTSVSEVSGLENSSVFNYNFTHEDTYSWNCLVYNNISFSDSAKNSFLITYDITTPSITVVSPKNNSFQNAGRFNVTLNENGFCLYSLDDGNNVTMNTTDNQNFSHINSTLVNEENYTVIYYCNDTTGNLNISESLFFTIDSITPNVIALIPSNGTNFNTSQSIEIAVNVSDSGSGVNTVIANINSSLGGENEEINLSNVDGDKYNSSYTIGVSGGLYKITFIVNDSAKNLNRSEVIWIDITDVTPPPVTIDSPQATTYTVNTYEINISLNEIGYCEYSLNGGVTNNTFEEGNSSSNFNANKTNVANGNYVLIAYCNDSAGNNNYTESVSFTVNVGGNGGTPSGGGGGVSYQTYTPTAEQASAGYTKELRKNDKIKFTFLDEKTARHTLTVDYIGKNFVNLTIQSPIKLVLGIGQGAKLNLTSPDYYDLYVELEEIVNNRAKLTIQIIYEEIPKPSVTGEITKEEKPEKEKLPELKKENYLRYFILISIIAILFIAVLIHLIKRKLYKEKIKEAIKRYKKRRKDRLKRKKKEK